MSTQPNAFVPAEQYLERERKAERKSEYFNGEIFAMAGATEIHNLLAGNAFALVHGQFLSRNCRVYGSNMRVNVSSTGLYTYPGLSAVLRGAPICG